MSAILDTDRLRALRLEAGMSQRELARRLGTTATVIRGLEEGINHNELSLRFAQQLATALAVEPAALFRREATEAPPTATADAKKLGAVVAARQTATSSKALASITGWPLPRVAAARNALNGLLSDVGMRVAAGAYGWKLKPDLTVLSWEDEVKINQIRHVTRGLKLREAELLRAALDGALTPAWEQHIGNADRVALGGLLKSGLVERTRDGVVPATSVRRSIGGRR